MTWRAKVYVLAQRHNWLFGMMTWRFLIRAMREHDSPNKRYQ